MPPRLSLRPLASACQSCATQFKAFLSSSHAPRVAPRYTSSNVSRDLLDVDNSNRSPASGSNKRSGDIVNRILSRTETMGGIQTSQQEAKEKQALMMKREEVARYASRKWKVGDVYSPHDLSPSEMLRWSQPQRPTKDIIDILGINPLDHYKNFSMISEYMTDMGRIKSSRLTGLRPVNQRKMAKAIRRAVGMGIHPSTHKHPMILYTMMDLKDFADLKAIAARKASGESKA